MNDQLAGRLHNWKFQQATWYLEGESEDVRRLVGALAAILGNVGWMTDSELGVIVAAALQTLPIHEQEGDLDLSAPVEEVVTFRRRGRQS